MERASALRLVEQRRPDFCARSACLAPVTGELSPPRGRNAAHCAGWSLQLQRRSESPNLIQAGGAYVFVNRYTFSASARLTGNGFSAR